MRRTTFALATLATAIGAALVVNPGPFTDAASADTHVIRTGAEQTVIGPSGNVDSIFATVRDSAGHLHAYMSNDKTVWYDQLANGTLTQARTVLTVGPKGSLDQCGIHPVGGIFKVTSTHWVTFYHAEQANPNEYDGNCYGGPGQRNHTRWSIVQMETFDAGATWHKGGQVLRQDWKYLTWSSQTPAASRDDAGGPRLVVGTDGYLYLFYRAVNRNSPDARQVSVARAPKSSLGKPGSWKKYYAGDYTEPGLGGQQSGITSLPASAVGISWNTYLNAYVSVRASAAGITLYESNGTDLTSWQLLQKIVGAYGTESAWGKACIPGKTPDFPVALGYGATIGWDGASARTGKTFWVYYMKKPTGLCFSQRYLVRREVAIDSPLLTYPTPTISTGEPTYVTRFSGIHKRSHHHGWIIKARLAKNGTPWAGRTVQVQVRSHGVWKVAQLLRTRSTGVVRLTGYARRLHRFHVDPYGMFPAANSATFRRPRH